MDIRTCSAPLGDGVSAAARDCELDWAPSAGLRTPETNGLGCSYRQVADLRVVECIDDAGHVDLLQQIVRRESFSCAGLQIIRSGSEFLRSGDECRAIGRGELVIWTTNEPIELVSVNRLHKVSLLVPWRELGDRLPRAGKFGGAVLDGTSGIGAVLYSHADALAREVDRLSGVELAAVRRATLELLSAAMHYRISTTTRLELSHKHLIRLQSYIVDHLKDEALSPASIAKAHNMSRRYLHFLFAQTGQGVSSYIRKHRLDRCKEALLNPASSDLCIAEIAHQWGFPAPAHFSRIFKQHFGQSPSELRRTYIDCG